MFDSISRAFRTFLYGGSGSFQFCGRDTTQICTDGHCTNFRLIGRGRHYLVI
jgi:hypothetical protein